MVFTEVLGGIQVGFSLRMLVFQISGEFVMVLVQVVFTVFRLILFVL